jgi:hypothetical protein
MSFHGVLNIHTAGSAGKTERREEARQAREILCLDTRVGEREREREREREMDYAQPSVKFARVNRRII